MKKIDTSRKAKLLDLVIEQLAWHIPAHIIVLMCSEEGSATTIWADALDKLSADNANAGAVFIDLIGGGSMSDDELTELLKPHLAERLKHELGAEVVKITW